MPQRLKKLIGTTVLICFVLVYALIAMALAQSQAVQNAPDLLQALYYVLIGMGWVLPAMPLIKWMEKAQQDHTP
jgi:predicted membrane channel-forming protein YqfA (hemolysin III family)